MSTVVAPKRLDFFERNLSLWVLLCMAAGLVSGKVLPDITTALAHWEFGRDSHVNIVIAVLIWLMIYPMMLKIDFGGITSVLPGQRACSSRCSSTG